MVHLEGGCPTSKERLTGCDGRRDVALSLQSNQFGFSLSHLTNEGTLPHLNDCVAELPQLRGSDYGFVVDLAVSELGERRYACSIGPASGTSVEGAAVEFVDGSWLCEAVHSEVADFLLPRITCKKYTVFNDFFPRNVRYES